MPKIPENGTWSWHENKVAAHGKKNTPTIKYNEQGLKRITHNAIGLTAMASRKNSASFVIQVSKEKDWGKTEGIEKRNSIQ